MKKQFIIALLIPLLFLFGCKAHEPKEDDKIVEDATIQEGTGGLGELVCMDCSKNLYEEFTLTGSSKMSIEVVEETVDGKTQKKRRSRIFDPSLFNGGGGFTILVLDDIHGTNPTWDPDSPRPSTPPIIDLEDPRMNILEGLQTTIPMDDWEAYLQTNPIIPGLEIGVDPEVTVDMGADMVTDDTEPDPCQAGLNQLVCTVPLNTSERIDIRFCCGWLSIANGSVCKCLLDLRNDCSLCLRLEKGDAGTTLYVYSSKSCAPKVKSSC